MSLGLGNMRKVKIYDNLEVKWNATVANNMTITNNETVGGTLQVDGTVTVGTSSVTISDSDVGTVSRNGDMEIATVGVSDLTLDVGDASAQVITSINGTPVIRTSNTDVNVGVQLDVGAINNWHRIRAENAVYAAGTWHLHDRFSGTALNLICGFGWDISNPGARGNTSSTFVQHDFNAPTLAGSNVAMLVLEQTIDCASAVVTMWRVDQYNESASLANGVPVPLGATLPSAPDNVVLPQLMVKGLANPGQGGSPGATINRCVQQIEIEFYNLAGAAVVPLAPVELTAGRDFVFDIKVCGCECVVEE